MCPTCYFARETEDQGPAETTQSMTGQKLEPGCPDSHLHMLGVTHKAKYYNNRWWNLLHSLKSVYFFPDTWVSLLYVIILKEKKTKTKTNL